MVLVSTTDPHGGIAQADGAASAEVAEDFPTALDTDRTAMLVAYTLLGAAINGFVPYLGSAGGPRRSQRHPTGVAALFPHRLCT
jgi:hypothetical protein